MTGRILGRAVAVPDIAVAVQVTMVDLEPVVSRDAHTTDLANMMGSLQPLAAAR